MYVLDGGNAEVAVSILDIEQQNHEKWLPVRTCMEQILPMLSPLVPVNRRGQPLDTVQNLGKYVHISSMEIPSAYTSLRVSCSLSAPSVFLSGL